jgi:methylthioribose-1-phosphate isomerase
MVLDQRRLPGEIVEVICNSGAEVAGSIRDGAVGPGPVLGPLAAYAMALTADRNVASRPFVRSATLRGTANALRNARPDSAALDMALTRVAAAWEAARGAPASEDADTQTGAAIAAAVRAEADAIATEAMVGLTRLVEHGVAVLPRPGDRPLEVVTIGATGPLSAGLVGTAMGIIAAVATAGRPIHAWVLEARPAQAGARIGAAELAASDVPATVIADGAIGWLFRDRTIDAVLVGADWIAANGDVANVTGTFPLAVMAVRHDVPVYVCAPRLVVSERKTTGNALTIIMRGRQELLAMPAESTAEGIDVRVPLSDVTPAELVTAYITDVGVLQAPFALPAALLGAAEDPATSSGEPAAPA